MRNFNLSDDNDLMLKGGKIDVVQNINALRSRLQSALQTFLGEVQGEEEFGVDYFGIILQNIHPAYKMQEFKRVIESISGVYEVEDYGYKQDLNKGIIEFTFTIKTIYGNITISQSVDTGVGA